LTDAGAEFEFKRLANELVATIATEPVLARAIVNSAARNVVGAVDGGVPCGTPVVMDHQPRNVRSGFCFPDEANGCNGSILENPADPKQEISLKNYYRKDSAFINFEDTSYRVLAHLVDPNNLACMIQPDDLINPDKNVFNYRNFFLLDPSDDYIRRNYFETHFQNNTGVRLRYAVGNCYPRIAPNLDSTVGTSPHELAEIMEARKTIGWKSRNANWMICPEIFTYRMLPLKPGFKSCYEYNKGPIRKEKLSECTGFKNKSQPPNIPDDVYLYTFVDPNGDYVTRNTLIDKKVRTKNTFSQSDVPYEDDFFIFPAEFKDTIVGARFPDGILLFSYDGMVTPIPPFGTAIRRTRLNNTATNRVGYPDGEVHAVMHQAVRDILASVRDGGANEAALNAKIVTIGGRPFPLAPRPLVVANFRNFILGAMAYMEMMIIMRVNVELVGGRNRITRNRRRRHNKSVKRNKTRSKSKGRSRVRARAMSMLKTAKKGFHEGKNYEAVGRAAGLSPSAFGGAAEPEEAPIISSFNAVGGTLIGLSPSNLVGGGGGAGGAPYIARPVGGGPDPYINPNFS
jgi:hypothetical protein